MVGILVSVVLDSLSKYVARVIGLKRLEMKNIISEAFVGLACLYMLQACSIYPEQHSLFASIGMTDHFTVHRHRNFVFPLDTSFYIPIPMVKAESSAVDVFVLESSVEIAFSALASRFPYAVTGLHPEGLEAAFNSAAEKRCNYVFYMEFIDIHDSVGFPTRPDWPGPGGIDRIHLKVILAEVKTRQIIDSIDIQSESGWSSFFQDRPIELLRMPLRNVSSLLSSQWH